jgi:hypothetical protein
LPTLINFARSRLRRADSRERDELPPSPRKAGMPPAERRANANLKTIYAAIESRKG